MKRIKIILIPIIIIILIFFIIRLFFVDIYFAQDMSMYKSILKGNKCLISKISKTRIGDIIIYEDVNSEELSISRIVAQENDIVKIQNQKLFKNNKIVEKSNVTYSYCFRYIIFEDTDSLKNKYLMKEINNSGFFQVELTNSEYEEIINDSTSDLRYKLAPIQNCYYNIFSKSEKEMITTVNADSVFILNDNRSDINDSRTFGLLPVENIIGKLVYVF